MSHADIIKRNYDVLLRCTTINCYVIDFLKAEDVLDREQEAKLRAKRNSLKQCSLLFQWLKGVSTKAYKSFLQVMNDTEQEHVTKLLTGCTEEDHLPLSEARHKRLDKIRPRIASAIVIDIEVIAALRSSKAISKTDEDDIRAEKADYAKISKLISAIMRRSNHSYDSFQEVLIKTQQKAAAKYLSEGEMLAVHINNGRSDYDEPLSRKLNDIIKSTRTDGIDTRDSLADMNRLGVESVAAVSGESIVIFVYCKTPQNAVAFMKLFKSGRFQYIFGCILNRLLLTIEPRDVERLDSRFSLEDDDIICLEDFTGIEGWMKQSFNGPTALGKICGHDASTQTNEESFTKKIAESGAKCASAKHAWESKLTEKYQRRKNTSQYRSTCKHAEFQDEYKFEPVLVETIITKAVEEKKKEIRGMTILDKDLFVVHAENSEVEVYDSRKLGFTRRSNLKELINALDIGSCNKNKCLYILDSKSFNQAMEILRVDSNGKLIKKWSAEYGNRGGLSVTDHSNVILTASEQNKLNQYSPDGHLICEINLSDAGIRHPWHAIQLTIGHFVVSQGCPIIDYDRPKVCTVNADGKLVKSFDGEYTSALEEMMLPVHLSVDGNGFVMVADQWNSRVLLLDSNLDFMREIILKERLGLQRPCKILLDELNGRLLVVDKEWNNQRILVFYIKRLREIKT